MKPQVLKPGTIIRGRYKVLRKLGSGYAGEVYKVQDIASQNFYALKLYLRISEFPEYIHYLSEVRRVLENVHASHLLLPLDSGVENGILWETFTLLDSATSLSDLIGKGPLAPSAALDLVSKIASGLSVLHKKLVIHADIKPENILIDAHKEPCLVDLGMARTISEGQVLMFGTYRYMHPFLRGSVESRHSGQVSGSVVRGIGPYIDLYSLGVVTLEMLTADPIVPHPLTNERLIAQLIERNQSLRRASPSVLNSLAGLLSRMLSVSATDEVSAEEVSAISASLARIFATEVPSELAAVAEQVDIEVERVSHSEVGNDSTLREVIDQLRAVSENLELCSAMMLHTGERLESASVTTGDPALFQEMSIAFGNASGRIRASWRIGIAMTILAFALTLGMIATSVVLGVRTGSSKWTLIFGGASAITVIGTLLWRPYDRAFRATILAQQIEMIHVQTITTFRGTTDLNRRIEVCREAISALGILLKTHAIADVNGKRQTTRRTKSGKGG